MTRYVLPRECRKIVAANVVGLIYLYGTTGSRYKSSAAAGAVLRMACMGIQAPLVAMELGDCATSEVDFFPTDKMVICFCSILVCFCCGGCITCVTVFGENESDGADKVGPGCLACGCVLSIGVGLTLMLGLFLKSGGVGIAYIVLLSGGSVFNLK